MTRSRDKGAGERHSGKFVSYVRVSTDEQGRSGLGQEAQMEAIRQYLNGGPWKLVANYGDIMSGRRDDRRGLLDALEHCQREKASLIVSKLDRLGRYAPTLFAILDSEIDIVICDTPIEYKGAGRTAVQMQAVIAEATARQISENTKNALAAKAVRGERLGAQTKKGEPDWQRRQKLAVKARMADADEFAAEMEPIIEAYQLHCEDHFGSPPTLQMMCDFLNNSKHPPYSRWKEQKQAKVAKKTVKKWVKWHPSSVRNLVKRIEKLRADRASRAA